MVVTVLELVNTVELMAFQIKFVQYAKETSLVMKKTGIPNLLGGVLSAVKRVM